MYIYNKLETIKSSFYNYIRSKAEKKFLLNKYHKISHEKFIQLVQIKIRYYIVMFFGIRRQLHTLFISILVSNNKMQRLFSDLGLNYKAYKFLHENYDKSFNSKGIRYFQ